MSSTFEQAASYSAKRFQRIEDAYEEVFELYTEGSRNGDWVHNKFAQQKLAQVEVELEFGNKAKTLHFLQNSSIQTAKGITGAVVWDSSICLAHFLWKNFSWLGVEKGKSCLELGSGCGVAGITCYHLGSNVHFTDQEVMLKHLEKNVKLNAVKQANPSKDRREEVHLPNVELSELMWGEKLPKDISEQEIDFVLASDCVYNEFIVPKLIDTLKKLSTVKTMFIIAQELRSDSVHLLFLEELLRDFTVFRAVQEEKFASSCVVIYLAWATAERP
ncbi:hypothetical protein K493DRAFT_319078 [Basidiobolus meristosporus CBS 931.73]|uniref:S-adenosyl-L-methionine-dependent methyltransferase n=1 Tax=Basidiobolus meristosporus CBS 931.73 TaxID=1314790 RepID=A0A1Y1XT95_9FUNG|nr:hypothetical protein K493DRAFT_319078 [Basidiobolus meristosporus CBS 931.73]|eukprot:ORX88971.1 hypothetical protein K493DRAFT_319078 [Basidiobolus meristosporus CBS 931.73]